MYLGERVDAVTELKEVIGFATRCFGRDEELLAELEEELVALKAGH